MKRNLKYLFLIVIASYSNVAVADSDGYYCNNTNYLAYEFNSPLNGHNLYIHFLSDNVPIKRRTLIKLNHFQTHGMRCSADNLVIRAWDAQYTFDLSNKGSPSFLKRESLPNVNELPFSNDNSSNLGVYSSDGVFPLTTTSKTYKYSLEIKVVKDNQVAKEGYIYYYKTTNLIKESVAGELVREYQIFKGTQKESVH